MKEILCLKKNKYKKYECGGPFKRVKTCPNGPKVIFLLIKTYFSEYLRPERSSAARRCVCFSYNHKLVQKLRCLLIVRPGHMIWPIKYTQIFPIIGYIYADLHEILLIILLYTAKYTKMCTFIIQDPP